jgi:uncharacterized Zn-finger protein
MVKHYCKHCDNYFSTKSSLTRHQRKAGYFLQTQGIERNACTCPCGKNFARNDSLERNQSQCIIIKTQPQTPPKIQEKLTSEELLLKVIDKYGDMVKDLHKQISELSSRPTTKINNLQPITDKDLQDHLDHLTLFYSRWCQGIC